MNKAKDNWAGLLIGLVLPASQSILTGMFAFFCSWPLAEAMKSTIELGDSKIFAASIAGTAALLMWLNLRSRWHAALESALGADLDNNGMIGQGSPKDSTNVEEPDFPQGSFEISPPPPAETKVFVQTAPNQTQIFKVDISHDKLIQVCRLLLQRGTFTYADFAGPNRLLSRRDYESLRSEFIQRNILTKGEGKSSSCSLTRTGRAIIEAIVQGKV